METTAGVQYINDCGHSRSHCIIVLAMGRPLSWQHNRRPTRTTDEREYSGSGDDAPCGRAWSGAWLARAVKTTANQTRATDASDAYIHLHPGGRWRPGDCTTDRHWSSHRRLTRARPADRHIRRPTHTSADLPQSSFITKKQKTKSSHFSVTFLCPSDFYSGLAKVVFF